MTIGPLKLLLFCRSRRHRRCRHLSFLFLPPRNLPKTHELLLWVVSLVSCVTLYFMKLARGDGKKSDNKVKLTWLNLNVRDRTISKYWHSNLKCSYSSSQHLDGRDFASGAEEKARKRLPVARDSVGDLVFSDLYEKVAWLQEMLVVCCIADSRQFGKREEIPCRCRKS